MHHTYIFSNNNHRRLLGFLHRLCFLYVVLLHFSLCFPMNMAVNLNKLKLKKFQNYSLRN